MVYYSSINIYNMSSCFPNPVSDLPSFSDSHCTSKQVVHLQWTQNFKTMNTDWCQGPDHRIRVLVRFYQQLFCFNSLKELFHILGNTEINARLYLLIIYMSGLLQSLKTKTKAHKFTHQMSMLNWFRMGCWTICMSKCDFLIFCTWIYIF